MLRVTVTGRGVAPEELERVFEPSVTAKNENGTGLGLAAAYGSAKRSGGYIGIGSDVGAARRSTCTSRSS